MIIRIKSDSFVRFWSWLWFRDPKYLYAVTIFPPFVILTSEQFNNPKIIFHESIHVRQMIETLIVGWIVISLISFIYNLFVYRSMITSYLNTIFELEAYNAIESRWYGWLRFRKKKKH